MDAYIGSNMTPRVLIISPEAPGEWMSGPAIRAWHLAQALASAVPVTLAVPGRPALTSPTVRIAGYDREHGRELRASAAEADVIVCSGFALHRYPFLRRLPQPLVVDLYDPFVLENLEIHRDRPLAEQAGLNRFNQAVLNEQLARADFFLCASETQRDFWLGMLQANGRVNPLTFGADPTLRQLIDVVPFGVPDEVPARRRSALKGVYPGIGLGDKVVYWGGGLWEWFDPLTAIRAMAEIAASRPEVKLFFAGVRHPNPDVPPVRMVEAARRLSDDLRLTGRSVFFHGWVPYDARADYVLDADVALSLHYDHVETHFAYRTRLLDYIWAGLPMVVTRGDVLGQLAESRGLARTVAPGSVREVVDSLLGWLDVPESRARVSPLARTFAAELGWSRSIGPLLEFCRAPHRAADAANSSAQPGFRWALLPKAWHSLRTRGWRGLWDDVRAYRGSR
jgi:glycosyltransferase involved in cell wall biosynthesis